MKREAQSRSQVTMDFYDFHFRCELEVSGSISLDLDLGKLKRTKAIWLEEGKRALLEFQDSALPGVFEELWDRLTAQSEKIISAAMYDWDALDQHPGVRFLF